MHENTVEGTDAFHNFAVLTFFVSAYFPRSENSRADGRIKCLVQLSEFCLPNSEKKSLSIFQSPSSLISLPCSILNSLSIFN